MRAALQHLKKSDPVLAGIIERVGPFRMAYRQPSFETMVRSILFQQLNSRAAATIFDRFVVACASKNGIGDDVSSAITPNAVLGVSDDRLRACGLSRQKLSYIHDLAEKTQTREVDFSRLPQMSEEEVIGHLTRVKGIGVWSAQMFLMFALRRPDIMPTTDYGIRAAMKKHYRKRELPRPEQMLKISSPWRPYRSAACWYLWRSLDGVAG